MKRQTGDSSSNRKGQRVTEALASKDAFEILATDRVELIQRDWDTLVNEGRLTPFQTPHWLRPWYAIVAPHLGARSLFVVVRDAISKAPLMLLPLCTRRQGVLRVVEFADINRKPFDDLGSLRLPLPFRPFSVGVH